MVATGIISSKWILVVFIVKASISLEYSPTWASLDSRPLPQWYDDSKFGIFLHWGVFSVPSFGPRTGHTDESAFLWQEWFNNETEFKNYMDKNYPPNWTYADFAAGFHAEFYNPDDWADLFLDAGAKYVVLVSKHHEGFTNWPSKYSFNWNSMDVGPKRDLVGDLAKSIRNRTNLHFGLYHSLFEWFNPLYIEDKANGFQSNKFVMQKTLPELYELVTNYHPEVVWSDGDWEAPDWYWNSTQFLAWLYNESPVKDVVVTNDRWGIGTRCHHGGYYTCSDKYNPGTLQKHKYENCMTVDKTSWGYRRNAELSDIMSADELIQILSETVSTGGNLLMNVGPTGDGRIAPIFEERLKQVGSWLKVNGDSIYSTKPWLCQNDTIAENVWYTMDKGGSVYAIVNDWPEGDTLSLGCPAIGTGSTVAMLGYHGDIMMKPRSPQGIDLHLETIPAQSLPCEWAWVFKFDKLKMEMKDMKLQEGTLEIL